MFWVWLLLIFLINLISGIMTDSLIVRSIIFMLSVCLFFIN